MKSQIKILLLVILLIMLGMLTVYATNTTANLNASKTQLYTGETFTVTMSVACGEGINGLSTVFSYDQTKLELQKSEIIDTTKWCNLGENLSFDIIHNISDRETSANIIKLTFKVKETAQEGSKAKITASNIKLDSDASINSIKDLGTKELEVSILERLDVNILEYEEEKEEKNTYIKKINPKTLIKTIKGKFETNGIIKIFKDNTEVLDENIKIVTGMEIRISLHNEMLSYKTVIKGDTDGDGDATFYDILQINKHRLKKASLQNEYLKAADLTGDGIADFWDILQINKYRLGKITSL